MKNEPELCCEPRCKNRKRDDRTRCHKCVRRRVRAANPMKAKFRALKDGAKRRGIEFRLTFFHFRKFALQTDYLNRTGPWGHCLTVDRIDNLKGYFLKNIQPLTRAKNAEKQARRDAIRLKAGLSWKT